MTAAALPLAGVRVLECGDSLALAYAGRLLADLGADVVKAERPDGDPLRAFGPFIDGIPDRDMSGAFAYFHAGKRSVVVPQVGSSRVLAGLARRADVVLRSTRAGDDWVTDADLGPVEEARPGLIVADISTLGRQEPTDRHPTSDLLALAAGGFLSLNASDPTDSEAPPLRYRGELSAIHAAANAVLAVLGALFERDRSGVGQRIDVSAQAAVTAILATALSRFTYTGVLPVRDGTRSVSPWGFYRCRDGMVLIQCTEDAEYFRLLDLLGNPEWGHMEIFATTAQREAVTDVLDMLVGQELAGMGKEEFLEKAYRHRVPAAPIHYARDILGWDHLAARGFLEPVEVDNGSRSAPVMVPGRPWRYRGEALPGRGPVPRLGRAGAEEDELWAPRLDPSHPVEDGGPVPGPLAGVRVVDLTWVWAGPYAAMQLAHLGADVIKVETSTRVDVTRRLGPFVDDEYGINRSGYFNQYNQGKRSLALNLKAPGGMELLERLLAGADVVIDNMSAGALDRMGLSYERLTELNPRIVAVSMTGFGESGPYADHPAYGSLIDAMSGTASANGLVGGGPTDFTMSLPDPTAGIHAAVATVGAVYRARRTGRGARVECAMLEAFVAAFPWPVIFGSVTGRDAPVIGNRDEQRSPHEVFRGRGGGDWMAIAVETDTQFAALASVMGRPELACDARFSTLPGRRLHEEALLELIRSWAADQDVGEAVAALQRAGVPAAPVLRMDGVLCSPSLRRRHFFAELEHPEIGVRPLAGVPWRASRSPMEPVGPAPVLGQHTEEVLVQVLGLDRACVARLRDQEVTL